MPQPKRKTLSQIIIMIMLSLGIGVVAVSKLYNSSFLAIFGLAIIFWGAILLYLTPSKHVPLTLLNASTEAAVSNIERVISELDLDQRGIYLPPDNLRNIDFSLVFIPKTSKTPLPSLEETNKRFLTKEKTGTFFTPPGSALLNLLEKELGFSFIKTDLNQIQNRLPKLLVEDLELAQNVEINIQENTVILKVSKSILDEICRQTDFQPKTHKQVGCLLSSAIACGLAKATGKPVIIQNETRNPQTETTLIEYRILRAMQAPIVTLQSEEINSSKFEQTINNLENENKKLLFELERRKTADMKTINLEDQVISLMKEIKTLKTQMSDQNPSVTQDKKNELISE
jgi:hypothetical protein